MGRLDSEIETPPSKTTIFRASLSSSDNLRNANLIRCALTPCSCWLSPSASSCLPAWSVRLSSWTPCLAVHVVCQWIHMQLSRLHWQLDKQTSHLEPSHSPSSLSLSPSSTSISSVLSLSLPLSGLSCRRVSKLLNVPIKLLPYNCNQQTFYAWNRIAYCIRSVGIPPATSCPEENERKYDRFSRTINHIAKMWLKSYIYIS